jgi:hypothetical protein
MSNPAIIEAAAQALRSVGAPHVVHAHTYIEAVLAAVTPLILEEAAKVAEKHTNWPATVPEQWAREEVAAAIRALKKPPQKHGIDVGVAAMLTEAVKVLEDLNAWYEKYGDTRAPLTPWVDAGKLLTRIRAALEGGRQVEEMKCSACGETRWLRKSMWHDTPICEPCFMVWYDPDESIDQTDPKAVGRLSMKLKAAGKAPWVGKYAEPEERL